MPVRQMFERLCDTANAWSGQRDDLGQDLLEYGLLAALIALAAVAAVSNVGTTIYNVFWSTIAASI